MNRRRFLSFAGTVPISVVAVRAIAESGIATLQEKQSDGNGVSYRDMSEAKYALVEMNGVPYIVVSY